MGASFVTSDELLAGAQLTFDVELPARLLQARSNGASSDRHAGDARHVRLRPLTLKDVGLIARAARDDEALTSALMIQRAAVEPALRADQVAEMPGGLVRFLVEQINEISGLTTSDDELGELVSSPLVQAFIILAREFGWTPQQVRELTVGQVLAYLRTLDRSDRREAAG